MTNFTNYITSEHINKPKFVETVGGLCETFSNTLDLLTQFPSLFDVDTAVGDQLDTIGTWVGVSRSIPISAGGYFSLDTPAFGLDIGVWWETGDSLSVTEYVSDDTYRAVIKAKILCNSWDGSLPGLVSILETLLYGTSSVISIVEGTLSVSIIIKGDVSSQMCGIITSGVIPLIPMGIGVTWSFLNSVVLNNDFGGDIS